MEDEIVDPGEIQATFQSLTAEADLLLQKSSLLKASAVYTKALELKPSDKHTLVKRAKCFILLGQFKEALLDAEACLKEDAGYHKAIFLKAEALYAQGKTYLTFQVISDLTDRGNKLRPELAEFRVGISKSREAINNSIGDPKRKILVSKKARKNLQMVEKSDTLKRNTPPKPLSSLMESKLLEELYEDKVYLQSLLMDNDFKEYPDEDITGHVNEGLKFLTSRIGFWRQQNPLYARRKVK